MTWDDVLCKGHCIQRLPQIRSSHTTSPEENVIARERRPSDTTSSHKTSTHTMSSTGTLFPREHRHTQRYSM